MLAPILALLAVAAVAPQAPPLRDPVSHGPIRHVTTSEPAVAITFDACATRTQGYGFDRGVFDLIKRERLPVTIFVSGRWVESHAEAMTELAGEPLVEFGDHSYDHPHMSRAAELDQTEAALARYGKRSVAFRPPFGEWSRRLLSVAQDHQMPTVTWDVVSGDPSARTTADRMVKAVVGKARPGSIIIFHINGRGLRTADALPAILEGLRARGFRFVPLSELLSSGQPGPVVAVPEPEALPAAIPIPLVEPNRSPSPSFSPWPSPLPSASMPVVPSRP